MAFAGLIALEQRHEYANGAVEAGTAVADCNAGTHGPLPRQAGNRHESAHALHDLIESGAICVRAFLPEAADACIHDAWIDLAHAFVVDAEPVLYTGSIILDDHVRFLRETLEHSDAIGFFQIERNAAPVSLQILKVCAVAFVERSAVTVRISRFFNLDDIRSPIRELAGARRTRARAR